MRVKWERIKLGDVCKLQGGFAFGSTDFKESGIPLIRISNITNKGIAGDPVFIDERKANQHSEFLLNEHDILIAMSGATTGKNCQIKLKNLPAILNQRTGRFQIFNTNKLSNDFLAFIVGFKNFQEKLLVDAIGGAQPNVSSRQIESVVFELPPLPQQRKIAHILSTCDAVIAQSEAAIAKYGALKQGLMHDLFTRGIDIGTGKLRPPRDEAPELYKKTELGWVPKEWEVKRLEEIAEIKVSNVDKKIHPGKQPIRLCNYMDVYNNEFITNNMDFMIGSADANELNKFTLQLQDVIITKDSETPDDIAIPAVVSEELTNVVCGYHLAIFRPYSKILLGEFLMYNFQIPAVQKYFFRIASGSTRYGLTIGGIAAARFCLPSKEEQKRITVRIKALHEKIQTEQSTLSKYRELKAGLMQDLLTGKVEVEVEPEDINSKILQSK